MKIINLRDGVLHLSLHREENGEYLLSLWDSEEQARSGGTYIPLRPTSAQAFTIFSAVESDAQED